MSDQKPMGCLYCGALWWPKDHPVHECVGSLKAKLEQAEKHQAPDPHAVPAHVLDTFIVSAGKELGYGTFLLQPENRISSLKAIMEHLIALVRQRDEAQAERDSALSGVRFAESVVGSLKAERDAALAKLAEAEKERDEWKANHDNQVAIKQADVLLEDCLQEFVEQMMREGLCEKIRAFLKARHG